MMAYSDDKISFKKNLLNEMYTQYGVFVKTGFAVRVRKDDYDVRYTSLSEMKEAIDTLETELMMLENGCVRRRCV